MICRGSPLIVLSRVRNPVTEKRIFQIKRKICYQYLIQYDRVTPTETVDTNFNLHLPFPQTLFPDFQNLRFVGYVEGVLHFVVYLNHSAKLAGWFFHHQRGYAKNAYLLHHPKWAAQRAESGALKSCNRK